MIFRGTHYRIVSASSLCSACGAWTHVIALALPADRPETVGVTLYYVEDLPESVRSRVQALAPWYRRAAAAAEAAPAASCWANHCEHCDALQDDHELHCEPGGAFMPASAAEAALLTSWDVAEPFSAVAGGCSHDPPF